MFWKRKVVERAPVMSSEKILEALAVDPETPLLQAILAVLAGMEETEKEEVCSRKLYDRERAVIAGRLGMAAEAQERILELAAEGRKRKGGK
jgi:hypothetical protein